MKKTIMLVGSIASSILPATMLVSCSGEMAQLDERGLNSYLQRYNKYLVSPIDKNIAFLDSCIQNEFIKGGYDYDLSFLEEMGFSLDYTISLENELKTINQITISQRSIAPTITLEYKFLKTKNIVGEKAEYQLFLKASHSSEKNGTLIPCVSEGKLVISVDLVQLPTPN